MAMAMASSGRACLLSGPMAPCEEGGGREEGHGHGHGHAQAGLAC